MGRRDFITLWLQALLLSLFPWLRTERGIEVAGQVADAMVPQIITDRAVFKGGMWNLSMVMKGFEIPEGHIERLRKVLTGGDSGYEVKT